MAFDVGNRRILKSHVLFRNGLCKWRNKGLLWAWKGYIEWVKERVHFRLAYIAADASFAQNYYAQAHITIKTENSTFVVNKLGITIVLLHRILIDVT